MKQKLFTFQSELGEKTILICTKSMFITGALPLMISQLAFATNDLLIGVGHEFYLKFAYYM